MGRGCVVRLLLGVGVLLLLLAGVLLSASVLTPSNMSQRLAAQTTWEQRPFSGYQLVVQVQRLGRVCRQELTVAGETMSVLYDECRIGWLPDLSVPQLFALGERLERPDECFPGGDCACARVRRGEVIYDEQLGYPRSIRIQRSLQPNWDHFDYWRRFLRTWQLPNCSSMRLGLTVEVVSLTPFPR
jgi:hypothetical protein